MSLPVYFFAAVTNENGLAFVLRRATPEAKVIIALLVLFSIVAWSVMASKATQMRRAKKLNRLFDQEFRSQIGVLSIYDRRVQVEGCPLFAVYQDGCVELDARLKAGSGSRRPWLSLKAMEHVKRALERVVAKESLR